ncbi:MAG: hypothetical protein UU93_C0005G0054 [Candidatus Amesbacteria bacterium GW2011_GWA2_42_12]|uniref:Phosphoribosyltransferase domain-containing protein n=1 Tax=Candidatus Amesbacteria bacterium GW2011_GWA2_42_12 TaxID=1618356 RepID=A0A0G1AF43_9BACT|nr:MAG: hypothetical protein UU93_C0005G0054 [Candidatus Amesbacteria bacterium GW2011_GWA2_42_12]
MGLWEEEQICPACRRASRYGLKHKYCHEPYGLDGLICLWAYEGLAQKIIKKAKYKHHFDFLSALLVHSSWFTVRPEFGYFLKFLETKPVIVPVPLHPKRLRERGFNQALIISKIFSQIWHLELNDCLMRVKDTGHQVGRTRSERLLALENAFDITPRPPLDPRGGANILLVDDVWTTGATMNECCKTLKKAGVKEVWGLVLAR